MLNGIIRTGIFLYPCRK